MGGAGVVFLQLMKGLTMRRTIAHMNRPVAVPHVTQAHTVSEFSVTLGSLFIVMPGSLTVFQRFSICYFAPNICSSLPE